MKTHQPYDPAAELVTESVNIGLPFKTKEALAEAARRRGTTMSGYARETLERQIRRDVGSSIRLRLR